MADATTAADSTPAWYTITGFIEHIDGIINGIAASSMDSEIMQANMAKEKERAAQDAKKAYFCEEFGCE